MLKRIRVKKGQGFGFGGLLTRFLRGHDIDEEEANYRTIYDPTGIDVTKNKEPEGVNGPILFVNECRARIDNIVRPGFEEPINDDVAIEDEMVRVDSDIESSNAEHEDSEMGEAALSAIDYEE
ncbi:hypothetical protein HAX54_005940 [Datura stramonium]|uniref:Uncharacterized protein n=1 Tax=Datura stramonium TaxID=4076 RepID=A0ABS8WTP9_DATST|nr:hypothetical protein [Datura stramonium]